MNHKRILAAGLAALLIVGPSHADYVIRDGAGGIKNIEAFDHGGKILPENVPVDSSGNPLDIATNATLAAVLAKLSSDPATQTTLAAILAKLSADPATQTTLAAVLAKLSAALNATVVDATGANFATTTAAIVAGLAANAVPVPLGIYQAGSFTYSSVGGTGNALLTNSAAAASSQPRTMTGFSFDNTGNSTAAYVQFFDLATGSVVLGTTVPKFVVSLPPGGYVDDPIMAGVTFATAVSVAVTTTRTGSVAASVGVAATIYMK